MNRTLQGFLHESYHFLVVVLIILSSSLWYIEGTITESVEDNTSYIKNFKPDYNKENVDVIIKDLRERVIQNKIIKSINDVMVNNIIHHTNNKILFINIQDDKLYITIMVNKNDLNVYVDSGFTIVSQKGNEIELVKDFSNV